MIYSIGYFYCCLWTADFLTGLFHWAEDAYCTRGIKFPILGDQICAPNLEHHERPTLFVRAGSFISRNRFQWLLAFVGSLALWFAGVSSPFWYLVFFLASFGNEVHRWNHMSKAGNLVTFIKSTGLIQSQKQHSLHHKPPHDTNYCVLTSQLNPILDALNFWRRLELVLSPFISVKRDYANSIGSPSRK